MRFPRPTKLFATTLIGLLLLLSGFMPEEGTSQPSKIGAPLTGVQSAAGLNTASLLTPQAMLAMDEIAAPTQTPRPTALPEPVQEEIEEEAEFIKISPEFQEFIDKVADGQRDAIRGVFVDGIFSLPVLQQPEDNVAYVSSKLGTVTQFRSAARNGVTGLLAHNYLSGALFYKLELGQEARIVYGDGSFRRFEISEINSFQKLTPSSLHSDLIDLATDEKVTTEQVFNRFYRGQDHLTFQTCLAAKGISNWGLTFIVATPLD